MDEGWENKEIAIGLGWLVSWVILGAFALYEHNLVLPYIFLAFAGGTYFSHLYLMCTRCQYFGKPCYLLGGIAAPGFFKARGPEAKDPDDAISATLWLLLGIFPVPFLLYYQSWLSLLVYSGLTYGWFYYRKSVFCVKCKTGWCPGKKG